MHKFIFSSKKEFLKVLNFAILFVLFIPVSLYVGYQNYTLFHTGVELYCAIIAFIILVIYLNSYNFANHNYFAFWGLASAFVGIFNLLHIIIQDGMLLFPQVAQEMKHHIWVTQRFAESFSFFFYFITFRREKMSRKVFAVYSLTLTFLTVTVFWHFLIPQSISSNYAYLYYAKLSEIAIVLIQLIALVLVIYFRKHMHPESFPVFLIVAIMLTVYELSMLLSPNNYLTFNILGHSFKATAYYMIYKAASRTRLQAPFYKLIEELAGRNKELEDKTILLEQEVVERKAMEKEIEASRDFYLEILEKFPTLIWRAGLNGDFNYFNRSWIEFTGRPIEHELNDGWMENIHQEDQEAFIKAYQEAFGEHKEFALSYRYLRYDGEYRWIVNVGQPFNDYNGDFAGYIGLCLDITNQKEKQEEAERYKLLTEKAKDIILFVGLDGKIIDANSAAVQAYGYTYEELTALTVYELREPGTLTQEQLKQAQESGILFETVHIKKDGSRFPVEVSSSGITIGDQKILMSVIRDITERKKAETLLRESEERYRSLIMNLNECFVFSQIILDDDGKPVDCITLEGNNTFFEMVGLKREDVIGKRALEITPILKNTTPNFFEICGRVALTGVKENFEMYFEDTGVWASFSSYSPAKGYFINIFTDITNRRLAEEEIRKLTRGIEQSPSVIVITSTQGIIEYVNPKFTVVTGYTQEDALGKTPSILKSGFNPNHIYESLWKTIRRGEEWRGELVNKKKNGDLYWTIISISPIRNSENVVTHYVAIQEDITAQKLLQKKIEENNIKLEEALERLKVTQGQLIQQEKLAGIGQLAAGVAHEINNPLGFVISNFETLRKYIGKFKETIDVYRNVRTCFTKESTNDMKQILQCIVDVEANNKVDFILEDLENLYKDTNDGLARIGKIVTSLRNFSRIDQQNDFMEYDLNAGIKNTLTVANNEIKYHARVEESLNDIPTIYANGGQINQVLLNIIMNAVHAIKEKQSGEMGIITVATSHDGQYVYCSIGDTGTGIAEEHLNRIFEPFFTTKRIGEGTGLGLSISYDIILHKHKGELTVDSTPGVGTKFTIKLPIKEGSEGRME